MGFTDVGVIAAHLSPSSVQNDVASVAPVTQIEDQNNGAGIETPSVDLSAYRFGSLETEELLCLAPPRGQLEDIQSHDPDAWSRSYPSLCDLRASPGSAQSIRVCIATEEIVGPIRNGGIGTTYACLAETLAGTGIDTTILYLRGADVENGTVEQWIEHYEEKGVKFAPVPNYAGIDRLYTGADRWLQASYNMMRYLIDNPMDVVHVSEWRGSAYLSLLAKRQGIAFDDTLFIVKASSPWLWN